MPTPREIAAIASLARQRVRDHVHAYMVRRTKSQADICRMTGVDDGTLSKALGDGPLGFEVFVRLIVGLGLDAHVVINEPAPKPKPEIGPE